MADGDLTDFTGKPLPPGASVGAPPSSVAPKGLTDFTGKPLPDGATIGKPEHVIMGPTSFAPAKPDFFKDPSAPSPSSNISSLDKLPVKDQYSINYFAKQGDASKLRGYLKAKGYGIAGFDADGNITFRDKGNNLYQTNGFAAIPAATNLLPVAGQTAGAIGGLALGEAAAPTGGGIVGESLGAGGGEAAGEMARNAILRHEGVPVDQTPKDIAENAAVAGGTQALASGVGGPLLRSLSGLKLGEEAATARTGEIAAAGDTAAEKQATKILKAQQGLAATPEAKSLAKSQAALEKFHATVKDSATEALGKDQEQRELELLTGRTGAQVAEKSGQLIPQAAKMMDAARDPYYQAYDKIKGQQGALFDQVFDGLPKETPVQANLAPQIREIKQFADQNQLNFSPTVKNLMNQTENLAGEENDVTALKGQVNQIFAGVHPDPTVNARFSGLWKEWRGQHGEQVSHDQIEKLAMQAMGLHAEPATLQQVMGLRSKWLSMGRSGTPADRLAAARMVDALDTHLENVPGMTPEKQAMLEQARSQYHQFKNVFDNKLQEQVFKAADPSEVAKTLFGGHPQVALNMVDAIKDNPEAMGELRSSYLDRVMSQGSPKEARKILQQDATNGVLKAVVGDGPYKNYQTWLNTENYQQYAERALATKEGQTMLQQSVHDAYGTPESRAFVDKFKQAQQLFGQKQAQVAGMPTPDQARSVETAAQTGAQSPNQAAANALYQSGQKKGGMFAFTGGGLSGYIKRRAAFGLIAGYMKNPVIWMAAGGEMAYDTLWSLAMRSPESAQAYWNFISKFAKPGGARTAGKAFMSLNSAMLDSLIRDEMQRRNNANAQATP